MDKKELALQAVLAQKILPLYYHESADVSVHVLQALYKAGIRAVEYTNRGENAAENFRAMRAAADDGMQKLQLGIGTVKNRDAAEAFVAAGADFVVCPNINTAVGEVVQNAGLLWIPGCLTPTEIALAEGAGARLVKLFPGSLLGPSYITAIRDVFPSLKFIVTGGVEAEEQNLRDWFGAGVAGVGLGSKVISKDLLAKEDYDGIKEAAARALALVQRIS